LLTLVGGIGAITYVAAIFLLPEGEGPTETEPRPRRTSRNFGLLLLAVAIFLLFRRFDLLDGFLPYRSLTLLLPLVLLAAGVLLVWPRLRSRVGVPVDGKFRRSLVNRVLAGVCGGLAQGWNVDPNLVRLVFVAFLIPTGGIIILVYLVLILVMPVETIEPMPPPPAAPVESADTAGDAEPASSPAPEESGKPAPEESGDSGQVPPEPRR
jgi:phage shock protein C